MRRRKLLGALAGLAVVVTVGAFALWPQPARITRGNYDRIRMRMSRAEVEAILGAPGGLHHRRDRGRMGRAGARREPG
jgi:hypothetical protein